jgi:hypothetical protein
MAIHDETVVGYSWGATERSTGSITRWRITAPQRQQSVAVIQRVGCLEKRKTCRPVYWECQPKTKLQRMNAAQASVIHNSQN